MYSGHLLGSLEYVPRKIALWPNETHACFEPQMTKEKTTRKNWWKVINQIKLDSQLMAKASFAERLSQLQARQP